MSKQDLTRQEEFKRATAGAVRAIAQQGAEVQVAFQPGPAGVAGKRARLPLPTRSLPPAEMAKLRGAADAVALKLRHHDEATHAARAPARKEAREVFDALEEVRIETVGARHMSGVAANLRARLSEECEAEGYDRMTRKDQLPLHSALALMARERISGDPAPNAARRVLDMWRDHLDPKASAAMDELVAATDDQEAFARAARKLLAAMDLAEAELESEGDEDQEGDEGAEEA
ncbi:MAG: cobaltochelatase subunit CobT, partial [Rubritepida sp.]|nr:cobaltochelatase subunit CobT [Rubritepida sp.]